MEQLVYALIGGGVIGALVSGAVTFWTTRHKPRVDTAQVVMAGQTGFIDNLQEQLGNANEEIKDLKATLKACEDQARQERGRHDTKEREWAARNDTQQRQLGALADRLDTAVGYILLIKAGVNAVPPTVPPWPDPPYTLHHLLQATHASDRTVYDTGVPGTEVVTNPPPTDDGQDPTATF